MDNIQDVVVVSGVRLPVASFGGSLKTVSVIDMGAMVVREAVKRAGISSTAVNEVIVGQVGQIAECGFVARAISLAAGSCCWCGKSFSAPLLYQRCPLGKQDGPQGL